LFLLAALSPLEADTLGWAAPYNAFAFGNFSSNSAVSGGVAANSVSGNAFSVGASLPNPNAYSLVTNSLGASVIVQNGNVYAAGANPNQIQNHGSGSVTTTGPSPLSFTETAAYYRNLSLTLAALPVTGTVTQTNPNQITLSGGTIDLTAEQFSQLANLQTNGQTMIVNVFGTNLNYQLNGLSINGQQPSGDSTAGSFVLFNFPEAQNVTLNASFAASVLAPSANINGNASFNGNMIGSSIAFNGPIHSGLFAGDLPSATPTPEISSQAATFLGSALLLGLARWRRSRPRTRG
jgi:choice-of-anchor A domain-containing protein